MAGPPMSGPNDIFYRDGCPNPECSRPWHGLPDSICQGSHLDYPRKEEPGDGDD